LRQAAVQRRKPGSSAFAGLCGDGRRMRPEKWYNGLKNVHLILTRELLVI